MKNYLAIDTSSKYLTVIACKAGAETVVFTPDCALQHSVRLMDAVESALGQAALQAEDCDFFCAVTGRGSFTGIRIGVSTVKGFSVATGLPATGVTSFEVAAYNASRECLAVVDAGRGHYYACGFDENKKIDLSPVYVPLCELTKLAVGREVISCDRLPLEHTIADPAAGLAAAVRAKAQRGAWENVSAFYLKKSQAEEEKGR